MAANIWGVDEPGPIQSGISSEVATPAAPWGAGEDARDASGAGASAVGRRPVEAVPGVDVQSGAGDRFTVGDTVVSDPYPERGTVAGVYDTTMAIVWSDGNGGKIIYPLDTSFIRKLYPWEV